MTMAVPTHPPFRGFPFHSRDSASPLELLPALVPIAPSGSCATSPGLVCTQGCPRHAQPGVCQFHGDNTDAVPVFGGPCLGVSGPVTLVPSGFLLLRFRAPWPSRDSATLIPFQPSWFGAHSLPEAFWPLLLQPALESPSHPLFPPFPCTSFLPPPDPIPHSICLWVLRLRLHLSFLPFCSFLHAIPSSSPFSPRLAFLPEALPPPSTSSSPVAAI